MPRLYGLDALRGVAALSVAIYHFAVLFGWKDPPLQPTLAVDLFFVLSGFVLTRTYEQRLHAELTVPDFIVLRYRRLFAPMAIGSTLGLVWASLESGLTTDLVFAYALILGFMPSLWMGSIFLLNLPVWSLFGEITSNVLHGVLFARLSTIGLFGLWFGITAQYCTSFLMAPVHWGPHLGFILPLIVREIGNYLLGILMFRMYAEKPLFNRPYLAIGAFVVLLYVAWLSPFLEILSMLAAAALIRATLSLGPARWSVWLGAISYPLYATHWPIGLLAKMYGFDPFTTFAFALLVAALITVYFEGTSKRSTRRVQSRKADTAGQLA
ncbi:acyltransferase [Sphingomonas sp. SM33]|uniref:Acyltransferase n=1 Tax=Sphingomonas telluris TaxID=2907998 RepID=A0ABS9VIJ9_9SPHN|nr:acyltransferase [Sphingomonas telluris]MCH8614780.1 acyltransferase [Sphingomonas telluris]